VDRGELERAFDEWDMVLRLADGHVGALRGMGFICFQQGRLAEAESYLGAAASAAPGDEGIMQALANVRAALAPEADPARGPVSESASEPAHDRSHERMSDSTLDPSHDTRFLFAEVLSDVDQTALLLDRDGLVLGGAYLDHEGNDVAQEVGAELSGVTDAARRATRHLALGDWSSIVFETEVAVGAMAPSPDDGLLVLATSRATPLGLVRRLLDRCVERATRWLGERAA
jgi:predicted regulator of Ras-like GTPase activity (Roadblock/LC7/MglB family)